MMKTLSIAVTVLLLSLASTELVAAGAGIRETARIPGGGYLLARQDGIPWSALSAEEQRLLARHRGSWSSYTPQEQAKLRRGVQRYLELPPDKRNAVNQKQQQYKNMSPEQRERLREKYRKQQRYPDS
jgi:hypothetical protein